ncbi:MULTISPECIES: protoheme IX farnesyltransferase [Geobacter]|uniref:protoheme IX farnesyltransferase n=1 Tax=Geobacter TaxID=28231 RepID=UPI002572F5E8|nr:protoheme IX farnesyltransferase [Geobacter sulfurreducens]BEH08578.1 protoheme IX farnesyltransferase [Geobacter sulfurreducens subsp. ethanolicus]BET60063.1 protoheme IX farnesyltransferase [Geobacter sp. 60473]
MTRQDLVLFRPRLALLNGIAAVAGHALVPDAAHATLWVALAGVAILAAGGSALNQVLERDLDRLMERTRQRPLPRGDLSPAMATALGCACIGAGLLVLAAGGPVPPLLGAVALAWYLAVYTPLKRRTSLALAIGAVSGALPPVIGWTLAGGAPGDYRIILLAGIFFLWQVPHFWLFQRRHADDYRRAGIPLFTPGAGRLGPSFHVRLWLGALAASVLLLPAFGLMGPRMAPWIAAVPLLLIPVCRPRSEATLFSCLNAFPPLMALALLLR